MFLVSLCQLALTGVCYITHFQHHMPRGYLKGVISQREQEIRQQENVAVYGAHREYRFAPSSSLEVLFRLFSPGTQVHEDLTVL